jgi:hypothetical protein
MPTTGTHPAGRGSVNDKLGEAEKENDHSDMKLEPSLKFQGQSPNYSTPSGAAQTIFQHANKQVTQPALGPLSAK